MALLRGAYVSQKIGHIGYYKKIENFFFSFVIFFFLCNRELYADFKNFKLTLGKNASQKVKMKNAKMELSKLRIFFLTLTFWGVFCHEDKLKFLNQHKILAFVKIYMAYLKKKISPLRRAIFQKFSPQNGKRQQRHKLKKNDFSKIV
jgi:hypothetical protein